MNQGNISQKYFVILFFSNGSGIGRCISGEIGGAWDQYTFNCAAESVDGGEFAIVITVVRNGE